MCLWTGVRGCVTIGKFAPSLPDSSDQSLLPDESRFGQRLSALSLDRGRGRVTKFRPHSLHSCLKRGMLTQHCTVSFGAGCFFCGKKKESGQVYLDHGKMSSDICLPCLAVCAPPGNSASAGWRLHLFADGQCQSSDHESGWRTARKEDRDGEIER